MLPFSSQTKWRLILGQRWGENILDCHLTSLRFSSLGYLPYFRCLTLVLRRTRRSRSAVTFLRTRRRHESLCERDEPSYALPRSTTGLFFRFLSHEPLKFDVLLFCSSSPDLPETEATFAITSGGIADSKEWWNIGYTICHPLHFLCSELWPSIFGVRILQLYVQNQRSNIFWKGHVFYLL